MDTVIGKSEGGCAWNINGESKILCTNFLAYWVPDKEYYLLLDDTKIISFVEK